MSYTKGDGAKIAIRFSDSVTVNGSSQTAFTVIVPEYSYVPGGTLQNVTKSVESVSGYEGISEVINMSNGTLTELVCDSGGVLSLAIDGG